MAFTPEKPANPSDLYASFDLNNELTGLVYRCDVGTFTREAGEWSTMTNENAPYGKGAMVVFVSPEFIDEFDILQETGSLTESMKDVKEAYGVDSGFGEFLAKANAAHASVTPTATDENQ